MFGGSESPTESSKSENRTLIEVYQGTIGAVVDRNNVLGMHNTLDAGKMRAATRRQINFTSSSFSPLTHHFVTIKVTIQCSSLLCQLGGLSGHLSVIPKSPNHALTSQFVPVPFPTPSIVSQISPMPPFIVPFAFLH